MLQLMLIYLINSTIPFHFLIHQKHVRNQYYRIFFTQY